VTHGTLQTPPVFEFRISFRVPGLGFRVWVSVVFGVVGFGVSNLLTWNDVVLPS
jgi:hypothetical protein